MTTPLPLGPHQWLMLVLISALILLDAVLAWVKCATRGSFSWSKFGLFVRKQAYVLLAAILVAVTTQYGPPSLQSIGSITWWTGAIAVALQYVIGDILGDKLGLIGGGNGMPVAPPGKVTVTNKVGGGA